MSLGIAFKGPEGIVLAADSRVTLNWETKEPGGTTVRVPATFDNATKLLRVQGQDYVGVVTYGVGALGQRQPRTAHSFLPEFEAALSREDRLPVGDFAQRLSDYFMDHWRREMPGNRTGGDMVFLVGGFDPDGVYGRVFEVGIPGHPSPVEQQKGEFGITWGGQTEATSRLLNGFDLNVLAIAKTTLRLSDTRAARLRDALRQGLGARIPYQFLPLQDCIDLAIFLVRTTAAIQSWQVGVRGVGGAIDVATITRTGGFEPVQQKHISGDTLSGERLPERRHR